MTMCGYNDRLQCIYGGDVSSEINAHFCVYCVHSMGIDTSSQKIHDDEVIKV